MAREEKSKMCLENVFIESPPACLIISIPRGVIGEIEKQKKNYQIYLDYCSENRRYRLKTIEEHAQRIIDTILEMEALGFSQRHLYPTSFELTTKNGEFNELKLSYEPFFTPQLIRQELNFLSEKKKAELTGIEVDIGVNQSRKKVVFEVYSLGTFAMSYSPFRAVCDLRSVRELERLRECNIILNDNMITRWMSERSVKARYCLKDTQEGILRESMTEKNLGCAKELSKG